MSPICHFSSFGSVSEYYGKIGEALLCTNIAHKGYIGDKVENVYNLDDVLEETLKREIREEVGLEIHDQIKYIESKVFTPRGCKPTVDIVFLCKYKSGEPRCLSSEEVSGVFWFTAQEIFDNEKAPSYLIDSIRKAENMRLNLL